MGCDDYYYDRPPVYHTISDVFDADGNKVGTIKREVRYTYQIKFDTPEGEQNR